MYAGPLESVIFQKRFPDQKIKSKVKKKKKKKKKQQQKKKKKKKHSHCAINRP